MKNYKLVFLFAILTGLWPFQSWASLSGSYTINSAASASSTNYKTFSSAVSDLISGSRSDGGTANGSGVSGAVTFSVSNGNYNEQIAISAITGASATNTITFKSASGDSTKVNLYYASSSSATGDYVVNLNGCQWVTFKGITIQRTGSASYATVVYFSNSNYNDQFLNCRIVGQYANNASNTSFYNGPGSLVYSLGGDSNILFQNNHLTYGYAGFMWYSGTGTAIKILNNLIDTCAGSAILFYSSTRVEVTGNTITLGALPASAGQYISYGIRIESPTSFRILKNRIYNFSDATVNRGIVIFSGSNGIIANNFLSMSGSNSSSATCIALSSCSSTDIVYNNVLQNSTLSTGSPIYNYTGTTSTSMQIINNNFFNKSGGLASDLEGTMSSCTINYNNLYTTGPYLCYPSYATLSAWYLNTGFDGNSVSVNPGFASAKDLHVSAPGLYQKGTPYSKVTDDIDGTARSSTAPTIGAHEFKHTKTDAGPVAINLPGSSTCAGTVAVKINIHNYGTDTLKSLKITWTMGGVGQTSYAWIGTLPTDSSTTITLGNYNFSSTVALVAVSSLPNNGSDNYNFNDTLKGSITVYPLPKAIVGSPASICVGASYNLGAGAVSGNTYSWTSKPAGFISKVSNPSVSPKVTTTYYLTEKNPGGCSKTDSVKITANPLPNASLGASKKYTTCSGVKVSIGDKPVSGNTYSWTGPGGFTASTSSISVTQPTGGTYSYYLTETNPSTGCYKKDTATLTVITSPQSSAGKKPKFPLCPGEYWVVGTTAIFGHTYAWTSNPAGFYSNNSNDTVRPKVKTTYYIVETDPSTGCSGHDSVTIDVFPAPAAYTGPDQTLCKGSPTTIGGAPVIASSYKWTSIPSGFTSTLAKPIVSPSVTTTYILTETDSSSCKKTDSVTVTVLPRPTPKLTGPNSICSGRAVIYKMTTTPGFGYKWNVKGGTYQLFTALDSILVTWNPGTSNKVYITETNLNNCSATDSIVVSAPASPKAGFTSASVCINQPVVFTNTSTGGTGYTWNFGDGDTTHKKDPQHLYAAAGNYKVRLTVVNLNGCDDTASAAVSVYALPDSGWSKTKTGKGSYRFTANNQTQKTYDWDFGDGSTHGTLATSNHTYTKNGTFTAKLTVDDNNGCQSWHSDTVKVTGLAGIVSMSEPLQGISVYPNPFSSDFVIAFELSREMPVDMEICDMTGRQLSSMKLGMQTSGKHTIEWKGAAGMSSGVYLLKISAGENVPVTKQLIKVE